MGYDFGSIVGDPAPADTFKAKIDALLTAHSAWTFIETWVGSSYSYDVWRCSGALNSWGQDFYIAVRWVPGSAGSLGLQVMEDWDATNKRPIRPPIHPGYTVTPDATYRSAMGYNSIYDTNNDLDNYGNYCYGPDMAPTNTVDFNYLVWVTNNGVMIKSSAGGYAIYVGLFESFASEWYYVTNTYEFPLVYMPFGSTDYDNSGSFTRAPNKTVATSDCMATYCYGTTTTFHWSTRDGSVPNGDVFYDPQGEAGPGRAIATKLVARWSNSPGAYYRGLYHDMLSFATDGAVQMGDTITVDGETWAYIGWDTWINTQAA